VAILVRMRGLGRVPVVTLMLVVGLVGCGPAHDADQDTGRDPGQSPEQSQDAPSRGSLGEAADRVDFDLPRCFVESPAYHVVTKLYPDVQASTPVASTVAGHPALTQTIRQPGDTGRAYVYEWTFVFAGSHLVQVMCQVDRKAAAVASGCATVRATLRLVLV
jgi:hypothetical protein